MPHTCSTLIINCMDFRLQKPLIEFAESLGLKGDYDLISVGGAGKSLASPKDSRDRDFLLEQIDISINLHKASKIIIAHHKDCGAYGGSNNFGSDEEEKMQHFTDMKKSAEIIKEKYPEAQIELYYIDSLDDKWLFEKIDNE